MSFWIVTDACCDLPQSYVSNAGQLRVLPLSYQIGGELHSFSGNESNTAAFYEALRQGKISTTSQINEETWKEGLTPLLEQGHDVLCLIFSSALSGTYEAGLRAVKGLAEQYPCRQVYAVDTLSASMGEGLMVDCALRLRDEKKLDITQTRDWIEGHKQQFVQWFTVDDLKFLKRGGRVSTASAFIGSALRIKPVLHVDSEGRLIAMEKVQGRKRSLRTLVNKIRETAIEIEDQTIFISHGDCLADAQWVADLILKELKPKGILLSMIGPIVGSHAGPGTIAIFWYGEKR